MASYDAGKIDETVRELSAFISSLPTHLDRIDIRYADEYHDFIDRLEELAKKDLTRHRLTDSDIRTDNDDFAEIDPDLNTDDWPDWFNKPEVVTDRLRVAGSRLLSLFNMLPPTNSSVFQHITIMGEGNQTVVGVAGGDLNQHANLEVRPGDDNALIASLEALKINQDSLDELKKLLEEGTDPDSKRSAVRKWIKSFSNNVLSGVISNEIASQAPAVFAMALAYLS